jgi:hypothetical protein
MESDVAYFIRRAGEERMAASHTVHPRARQSHSELAERYEDFAHAITARERYFGLRKWT